MADGVVLPVTGTGTADVKQATDDCGDAGQVPLAKLAVSADGSAIHIPADATNGLDVDVTRVQGTVAVSGPLTDAQLRASAVPVTIPAGDLNIGNVDVQRVGTVADANNSTTTALGAETSFIGTATDASGYSAVSLMFRAGADAGGAIYTLRIDWSGDGTNWDYLETITTATVPHTSLVRAFPVRAKFFRVIIINVDAVASDYLRCHVLLHTHPAHVEARGTDGPVTVGGTTYDEETPEGYALQVDHDGRLVVIGPTADGEAFGNHAPVQIGATDGSDIYALHCDSSGKLHVAFSALPAGDSNIGNVDVVTLPALPAGNNNIGDVDLAQYTPVSGRLPVDGSGVTQPVSAASLPLPTGAATAAGITSLIASTDALLTDAELRASPVPVDVSDDATRDLGKVDVASLDQYTPVSGRLPVDGSGVTQPVSGPVTDAQLRASAVPVSLPAGDLNIGNVDVLTVPAPLSTTGGGTEAAAQRVTIATDSTGVLSVDDNGGSLTVDGTVAVSGSVAVTQAKPATYHFLIPSQVHVAGANTVHWDLFNAHASLIVRVTGILQIPNITTAVTGIVFDWLLERTTAVGTGGSALTAWLADLNDTALDAAITCRSKPTGGATQSTDLRNYSLSSEETNAATIQIAAQGGLELVPEPLRAIGYGKGLVLRQNQGLRVVQVTNSNAGNTGWLISFTVE